MSSLRKQVLKLAHAKKELRPVLIPLLKKAWQAKPLAEVNLGLLTGDLQLINILTKNPTGGKPGVYGRFVLRKSLGDPVSFILSYWKDPSGRENLSESHGDPVHRNYSSKDLVAKHGAKIIAMMKRVKPALFVG